MDLAQLYNNQVPLEFRDIKRHYQPSEMKKTQIQTQTCGREM